MPAENAQDQIELHKKLAPRYAYRYSFEFNRVFEDDWHAEMISHVPAGARRVLDLGCGTGVVLSEMLPRHPQAVGLDLSLDMLKVGRAQLPEANLVTGDAEALPFRPGCFEAVVVKGCLHHARDHVGFLENCCQALGPEGLLIMSEPCNDNPLILLARKLLYRFSSHFDEGDLGFGRKQIEALYREAGFEIVRTKKYGFFAYVLAGFPDHIGLLRWIPGSAWVTKGLVAVDRLLCGLPGFSLLGFQVLVVGKPRDRA